MAPLEAEITIENVPSAAIVLVPEKWRDIKRVEFGSGGTIDLSPKWVLLLRI
jgi:hypothetical protein